LIQGVKLFSCTVDGSEFTTIFFIFQKGVIVFAFSDIFGGVALSGDGVVDKTKFTTLSSWADSVQADVELGTIICISILWMRVRDSQWIRSLNFWAGESVDTVLFVISFAVCSFGIEGPVTYSFVLIKVESRGASIFFSYTINTGIKDVADGWLGVSIKSVETWAKIICSLRLLELKTVFTVYVEVVVTRFPLSAQWVKNKTIWTDSYFGNAIETVIVSITK